MMKLDPITVVEVGPRDGLQYESVFFPTQDKIALINSLSQTGLKRIEVTSFVHPKVIPHLKDAMEVLRGMDKAPGVIYSALVPNLKGCQRALETPVDELALFVSASQTHNQKNVGMSIEDSLSGFADIAREALTAGKSLRGYVITAFGCPYEGAIALARVEQITEAYAELGVREVSLGDTTGMANPRRVSEVFEQLGREHRGIPLAAHFHNSRGLGLANAYAAYQTGCRVFDSSVGGLGGCPTAVGAMGNIPTEDLVNLMEEMGVSTGLDFTKLMESVQLVQRVLGGELASYTCKQGRPNWGAVQPKI
ncbi:MAG: hydroxymethylglutaryl-CoA lyase [Proteobacteria bacterium]|nr:hydroxymethylglutaryl-CoA lyase [Pseudomonadota bacterium]MBU2518648.1 hydroxymethylglutaryl-CoA lyase [Pseudomonadota bacterium]